MLRRYLIINAITTAIAYAGVWAFVPSGSGLVAGIRDSFVHATLESSMLAPLVHRVVTVTGRW